MIAFISMALSIFLTALVVTILLDLLIYYRFGDARGPLSIGTLIALCIFFVWVVYA